MVNPASCLATTHCSALFVSGLTHAEIVNAPVISNPVCAASVMLKVSALSFSKSADLEKPFAATVAELATVFTSVKLFDPTASALLPETSSSNHLDITDADCGSDPFAGLAMS